MKFVQNLPEFISKYVEILKIFLKEKSQGKT